MPAIIRVVDGRTIIKVGENTVAARAAASLAEQFANAANLSADAAAIAAAAVGVYTTVGDGVSATTNGQSFYVASGGEVTLYINNAGTGDEVASLVTAVALASTAPGEGATLVGFSQSATNATARHVLSKLRDDPISLLDVVDESDKADITSGVIAADTAFTALLADAANEGKPARITKGNYKLTSQQSIPSNTTLILEPGVEIFIEDDTLESAILIEDDNVTMIGKGDAVIRAPLTNAAGLTGVGVLVRNTNGTILENVRTSGGKYGIMTLDNTNLFVNQCRTYNSYNWGFLSAGNQDFVYRDCSVNTTRNTGGVSDCFKVVGQMDTWSVNPSFNGFFIDCYGENSSSGQVFDIIASHADPDSIYNIYVTNPTGRNCGAGFLEVKIDSAITTSNWPIHDIHIQGGFYQGDGTETGVYVADRTYNIFLDGQTVTDVDIGATIANPVRYSRLKNFTCIRPRKNGINWTAGAGGGVDCVIDNPIIVDPNYGQGASTYSGIKISNANQLKVVNPTVRRSQEPSGSAHSYGIEIVAGCTNISIEGTPRLQGHATAAINDLGTTTRWPVSLQAHVDLAEDAAQFYTAISQIPSAFYACRIGLFYEEGSNVSRDIQIQARNPSSVNIGTALTTSAVAAFFDTATQSINPPVRVTYAGIVAQTQATTLPGSPTGKVLVTVYGFFDGSSAS